MEGESMGRGIKRENIIRNLRSCREKLLKIGEFEASGDLTIIIDKINPKPTDVPISEEKPELPKFDIDST
jgi:hypothetical protein